MTARPRSPATARTGRLANGTRRALVRLAELGGWVDPAVSLWDLAPAALGGLEARGLLVRWPEQQLVRATWRARGIADRARARAAQ